MARPNENEGGGVGNASVTLITPVEKLAFNKQELCAALGVCGVTLYRLEQRGILKPVPGLRHKLYSREAVMRFLAGKAGV